MGDKTIPVSSEVKGMVNSKGKANVDEEGRVVEKKNSLGKLAGSPARARSSAASPAGPRARLSGPESAPRPG